MTEGPENIIGRFLAKKQTDVSRQISALTLDFHPSQQKKAMFLFF